MAATSTISVGSYGQWKAQVSITETGLTYHKVSVKGTFINNGTSTAFNNNGVSLSVSGSDDWSGTAALSVPAGGSQTAIARTFTITHTASKTLSYRVGFGATGTSTFGTGASTVVDIVLPTLATAPEAPTKPSITSLDNTSVTLDINDNDDGGSAITKREIGVSTGTSAANANWYTANSSGAITRTGWSPGTKYYAWGRVTNAIGVSEVSARRDILTHDVPDQPGQPTVGAITNTTAALSFVDGDWDGGSPITARSMYWNTVNSLTDAVRVTGFGNSGVLSGLPPGTTIYAWSRVANEYGGSAFSVVRSFKTHNRPSPPTQPVVTNITQDTATATFSDGAANGGTIDSRQLLWSETPSILDATIVASDGSTDLTGLPPGSLLYLWARTHNTYGWSELSPARSFRLVAGAWVNVNGEWKPAVPYVNVNGVWKLLTPYLRSYGVWQGGG